MTTPSLSSQQRSSPRTYEVCTFGYQMNVHDLERLSGLLEESGYVVTAEGENPDLVVFNTYAVREDASNRPYGTSGQLKPVRDAHPGTQIAVGGYLARRDKDIVVEKAPRMDVVFDTRNLGSLLALLGRATHNNRAEVKIKDALEGFPSVLPAKCESTYAGWVSISVGCSNTCTFCTVPSLRDRERGRRPGETLAEVQTPVGQSVTDVTLLGQNVSAYDVNFADPGMERDRSAFSELLCAYGQVEGLERVRFTPPYPAKFTDDVVDAMAETSNVVCQLHMPLQFGSDRIPKDMRRSYRIKELLGVLDKVREKIPDAAITADIIVSFPGKTEEDFQTTLNAVEKARFNSAFTLQCSPYPGTPAAAMPDRVPPEIVEERYGRLLALQEHIFEEENVRLVGRKVGLPVSQFNGRKNAGTHRMSGRSQDGRLMHFSPSESEPGVINREIRPGDYMTVRVTSSTPHFLIASSGMPIHRRTKAGDNVEVGQTLTTAPIGVGLGLPKIRRPEGASISEGCGCE